MKETAAREEEGRPGRPRLYFGKLAGIITTARLAAQIRNTWQL